MDDRRYSAYTKYTIIFWIFIIPILTYTYTNNLIAIGGTDGFSQHYVGMVYTRKIWRNFLHSIVYDKKVIFPMYDFNIGMGGNVLATMNWYGITDPFYFPTVFIPERLLVYYYTFIFYFRIFVGGLACIAFFRERNSANKKPDMSYIIGALAYCFTGFTVQCNIHIIFTHALLYTPMMFYGAERRFNNRRGGILVCAVFLYALSGFYYLYISSIGLGIYVLWNFIEKKYNYAEIWHKIRSFVIEYALGIGLGAAIFLPSIEGFFNSTRVGGIKRASDLFEVNVSNIIEMIKEIFIAGSSTFIYNTGVKVFSLTSILVLTIIYTLISNEKKRKRIFLCLFLMMIIPAVSWIMSGFGKIYDRWEILVILYLSYVLCCIWDDILSVEKIVFMLAACGIIMFAKAYEAYKGNYKVLIVFAYICLYTILMFVYIRCQNKKYLKIIFAYATIVCIFAEWMSVYRTINTDWSIRAYKTEDDLIDEYKNSPYRIEYEEALDQNGYNMNRSTLLGYKGIQQYYSIENFNYVKAFEDWDTWYFSYANGGLDQRTVLETLASVKYFIVQNSNNQILPYGYKLLKYAQDENWGIYENLYSLPLIYSYSSIGNYDMYVQASGIEKQNIILRSAVLENYDGKTEYNENNESKNRVYEINYTIFDNKNNRISDDVVTLSSRDTIYLEFCAEPQTEYYLEIEGNSPVLVYVGDSFTKHKLPANIGHYDNTGFKRVKLEATDGFKLNTADIKLYGYCLEDYAENIKNLRRGILENTIICENNQLSAQVDFDEDRILCASVPYEKGWTAYVDGKKEPIYKLNSMYMGLEIPEGCHEIKFIYRTPGLYKGVAISIISLLSILGYSMVKLGKRGLYKI